MADGSTIVADSDSHSEHAPTVKFPLPATVVAPRDLNEHELAAMRHCLSAYAASLPHFGIEGFGEAIEVIASQLLPVYTTSVNTLYEKRIVERREAPYRGEDLPPLNTSEDNIDVWSYDFPRRSTFEEFQDEQLVEGSQAVHDCDDCGASGRVTCADCDGRGEVCCPTCSGTAAIVCPQCRGRGAIQQDRKIPAEKRCLACGGSGRPTGLADSLGRYDRCPKCFGRGFYLGHEIEHFDVPCNSCGASGQVRCSACNATGAVSCSTCVGQTTVTCTRCEGRSQVLSLLVILRSFHPTRQTDQRFGGEVSENVAGRLLDALAAQDEPPLVELEKADQIEPSLKNMPHSAAVAVVADSIRKLLSTASAEETDSRRAVWQSVQVGQTAAARLNYRYSEREYEAWAAGGRATLLPMWTPFADLTASALESALAAWEQGDRSSAVEQYRRCREIAAKDETINTILKDHKERTPFALQFAAPNESLQIAGILLLLLLCFPVGLWALWISHWSVPKKMVWTIGFALCAAIAYYVWVY